MVANMKDYDQITAFLGDWGRFQQIVFFVLSASIISNGIGALSMVFIADTPKHHCFVPDVNLTEDWVSAIIPIQVVNGEEEVSRCSRYRLDVVRNLSAQGSAPGDMNLTELQQEPCVDGWSYSKDIYQSTLVTEFDLVCSDQWKPPFTSTIYYIGVLFGSFFCGQLSDRFGRKPIFFSTLGIQSFFTFIQVFSTSWEMFVALQFFSGLGQSANYVSAFVLGAEVLSGNAQTLYNSFGVCAGFAVGYMMLPLFAYLIRYWRFLLLPISMSGVVFLPFWWITPESPRWLLFQGKVKEAEAIVRKAAAMNKVKAPSDIFENYNAEDETDKKYTVIDMYRHREMRFTSLILALVWFTVATCYYAISLNTSNLSADPFISSFISGAVEVPAYVVTWLALKYCPRRLSMIAFMVLGAVSLFTIQAVPSNLPALSITLEMISKSFAAASGAHVYPVTAELYPTFLRNTATGTCSTCSRVGTSIAPFIFQLSVFSKFLPYIVLGSLSLAAATVALFLPETLGHPLPETIEDIRRYKRLRCPCSNQSKTDQDDLLETKL